MTLKTERAFGFKTKEVSLNTPLYLAFMMKHDPETVKRYLPEITVGTPFSTLVSLLREKYQDDVEDGEIYEGSPEYDLIIDVIRKETGLLFNLRTDGLNTWLCFVDKPSWNYLGAEKTMLSDNSGSITARSIELGIRNVLGEYFGELGVEPQCRYVQVLITD